MLFSHPRNPLFTNQQLSVTINESIVEHVSSFKYLGIHLDNHLSFNEHVDVICKRVDQRNGLLWRVRRYIPESLALHLYKSLIHPHFLYCAHLYDGCNLTNQRKLQVRQNNALRAVTMAPPRHPTELLHRETGIDWLDVERAKSTCIEAYKCLHDINPPAVCSLIKPYAPSRTTRLGVTNAICCPFTRTRLGETNFPCRAHHYWKILPENIRTNPSLNGFKDSIKKFVGFTHVR